MVVYDVDCFVKGEGFGWEVVEFYAFGALPEGDAACRLGHHPTVLSLGDATDTDIGFEAETQ